MFLFLKLCLAHLIADFILQFEELYQFKVKQKVGQLVHASLHAGVSLLILYPYLNEPFIWIYVVIASTVHMSQDLLKYKYINNKKYFFWIFTVDQIVHFLVLSTIMLFPISREVRGLPTWPNLDSFYTQNEWTLYMIAFLGATFCGNYLLHAFNVSYFKNARRDHFISTFESVHGIFERTIIAGVFLLSSNPLLVLTCPAVGLIRIIDKRIRSTTDFVLSFLYAALLGLIFRMWI
jgi:hypothetical protein